jgi:membrane-associated protease RseP (regulator of RpoE activity)
MVIDRDGTQRTVTVTPVRNLKFVDGSTSKTKEAGFLGVSPTNHHYYTGVSITAVPRKIGDQMGQGFSALGRYPQKIGSLWDTVFHGKPRDASGAIGVVGIGRIGGEIAETNQFDLQDKIVTLVSLLASVNLLLFLFNLLPLLPLDGGHVAGAIVEGTRRGWARLRVRKKAPVLDSDGGATAARSPIYVDTAQMLPVMYMVASVLIVLTLLTFYADIFKPVQLFGG